MDRWTSTDSARLRNSTAWFMAHRIREGMAGADHKATGGLGGKNKAVEVDETYVGGKGKNRAFKEPEAKKAVVSRKMAEALAKSTESWVA